MERKTRIDKLLFDLGLAPSRERAQAYIMAGKVLVEDKVIDKAGTKVLPSAEIRVKGVDQPYVGRGGLKLRKALQVFNISAKYKICMDIGASTGGFTDCLLQHGAAYVFSIDVGHNQLDWKLASHEKVRNMEKTHFTHLTMDKVGTFVDLIVIDVSFISLTKILPNCRNFLAKGGSIIALIKPQFEAGKEQIRKGGIVTDPKVHQQVITSIEECAQSLGFASHGTDISPIQGKKSRNSEFLIHLSNPF